MTLDSQNAALNKRCWWALVGLAMALVILNLDLNIVNLALPILGQRFHANLSTLQWVNNVYSLTFAALVLLAGKVADRHGHRMIYLRGVCFFFLGSLVGGFATNMPLLIIGRLLQGVGMAGTFGMVFILANAAFPPNKRAFAVGLLVVFVGISQAIGPTLGGFIVEVWGWRFAFLINLPFCVLSFVLVRWACKKDDITETGKIHYPSGFLLILSYFLLVFAFNEMQHWGVDNWKFLTLFIVGILIFVAVMIRQKFLPEPYFDLSLFRIAIYRSLNLIRPLFQFNFGAFFFVLPLYLQNIVGMTPSESGLVMLIMTAALAVSSFTAGRFNGKVSPSIPLTLAHVVAVIGYVILALMPIFPINWWLLSIALIGLGINVGIMYSTTNFLVVHHLPANRKGVGYGFFSANAYFFYSIGIALAGYLLATVSSAHLNHLAGSSLNLKNYASGAHPIANLLTHPQGEHLFEIARQAFGSGFSAIMCLFAVLSFIGLLLSLKFSKSSI